MTVVEGNHIRVDRACPPRKKLRGESTPLYDNKRTVFVGNLPFDVKEAAHSVVKKQNLKLRDRELRLSHAKADAATLSKRPYSSRPSHAKADTATPSKRLYSSPAQAHSTPAKLSVASRSPSSTNNRSNRKATASYQGLRATKSDVHKKTHGGETSRVETQA